MNKVHLDTDYISFYKYKCNIRQASRIIKLISINIK